MFNRFFWLNIVVDFFCTFGDKFSRDSIIFKIVTRSFLQRGADLAFLSAFPGEDEFLLPPLTCLRPTGRSQVINFQAENEGGDGGNLPEVKFTVIEVEPLQ